MASEGENSGRYRACFLCKNQEKLLEDFVNLCKINKENIRTSKSAEHKVKGAHFVKKPACLFCLQNRCAAVCRMISLSWNAVVVLYAGVLWQYWESKEMQ